MFWNPDLIARWNTSDAGLLLLCPLTGFRRETQAVGDDKVQSGAQLDMSTDAAAIDDGRATHSSFEASADALTQHLCEAGYSSLCISCSTCHNFAATMSTARASCGLGFSLSTRVGRLRASHEMRCRASCTTTSTGLPTAGTSSSAATEIRNVTGRTNVHLST